MGVMRRWLLAAIGTAGIVCTAAAGGEPGTAILDIGSFWRFRTVWETEEILLDSGQVDHVVLDFERGWFSRNPGKMEVDKHTVREVPTVRLPADTPRDWMKSDFDASTWVRSRGPMLEKSENVNWKLVLMRGRFEVPDPANAGDLRLSMRFRGGAVVYLNGKELTRAFMPKGDITPHTPAEAYPTDVFLNPEGYVVWPHDGKVVYMRRYKKRIRRIADFRIPASRLQRGVNVLAIAIHRAPADPALYLRRIKRWPSSGYSDYKGVKWCRATLVDIQLVASRPAGITPNVGRPTGRGFVVWNHSILRKVRTSDYPDPFAPLQPVRLTGVRNGTFAGQVVVGHDGSIKNLTAEATPLTGPMAIPVSAVQIRYPLPDGEPAGSEKIGPFDSLEEFPPAEVPVYEESAAIQPVWITVTVPAGARPGDYEGTVTIKADGVRSVVAPLHLRVIDWTLPPQDAFAAHMDIVQSPESVARAYGVPIWSEEHFKLLDKTFNLLAPLADKTIYISCVRRTHFGNQHAMVRWARNSDSELDPDFTIVEKYLDVATKHLGKVPGVILYAWEPQESMGHAGGAGGAGRTSDRPILISVKNPRTGRLRNMKGPAWATPEAKVFWRKLTDGMREVLAERGLADSMKFGLIGDCRPTRQAMDDITTGITDAKWAVHSHHYCDTWQGYKIGFCSALWGIHIQPMDPAVQRAYGWQNPFWLVYYPREMSLHTTLVETRTKLENWMGAGSTYHKTRTAKGLGRIGADFWRVLKSGRSRPKSLAGRYPESYWGQLNLNYCVPHLLGRGKNGPLATVRSEMFRENVQEVEARVFLEKALIDKTKRAKLGDDLAERCRAALDGRIRMCLHAGGEGRGWFISSDWNNRNERLFRLASDVAAKLRQ